MGKDQLKARGGYWPWRQPNPKARARKPDTEVEMSSRTERARRAIVHAAVNAAPAEAPRAPAPDPALAAVRRLERSLFALGGLVTLVWATIAAGLVYERLAPVPVTRLQIEVEPVPVEMPPGVGLPGSTPPGRPLAA